LYIVEYEDIFVFSPFWGIVRYTYFMSLVFSKTDNFGNLPVGELLYKFYECKPLD